MAHQNSTIRSDKKFVTGSRKRGTVKSYKIFSKIARNPSRMMKTSRSTSGKSDKQLDRCSPGVMEPLLMLLVQFVAKDQSCKSFTLDIRTASHSQRFLLKSFYCPRLEIGLSCQFSSIGMVSIITTLSSQLVIKSGAEAVHQEQVQRQQVDHKL